MRIFSSRWLAGLIIGLHLLTLAPPAHAFLPLAFAAGRIGAFIGAAIPHGMRAAGYAARDPRMATTVLATGRGLAKSLGSGFAGLPWGKTAVYSGLGVVGGVGGAYSIVGGVNWLATDKRDSVNVETPGGVSSGLPVVGNYIQRRDFLASHNSGSYWVNVNSTSGDPKITRVVIVRVPCVNETGACSISGSYPYTETELNGSMSGPYQIGGDKFIRVAVQGNIDNPNNRNQMQLWEFQPAGGFVTETPTVIQEVPIDDAMTQIAGLASDQLDQPLNDVWLAGLANSSHYAATQELKNEPGYWPWAPQNQLVKPADISKIFSDNPALVRPTIRDLTESIAPPTATVVPLPIPDQYLPGDGASPPIIPGNPEGTPVDWGPDPNVGAPNVEAIPTAEMIIAPIANIYPELKNASFSIGDGECPRPEFNLFGGHQVMDQHCVLFEQNRTAIGLAMILSWSITSFLIVLRA